jgi:Ser/Thr protein kinase RdoA (MazF antagonist)
VTVGVADVAAVCGRFGLVLEELLPTGRGSVFVARVRDRAGRVLVLKRPRPETGSQELAALRAWSGSGLTPRLLAEPEPGLYLAEWFDGTPLHEAADPVASAVGVGAALRRLHGAADPPPACFDTRDQFSPVRSVGWGCLDEPLRALRGRLADDLLRRHPPSDVLLHGDLAPANVLVTAAGPRLIDPLGRRGLAAWDLAQLAVTAEGRGVRRLLPALLEGCGQRPPLIDEAAAWMVLTYLDKNLAAPGSPHTPHLRPLARALLDLGDPTRFAALHLT